MCIHWVNLNTITLSEYKRVINNCLWCALLSTFVFVRRRVKTTATRTKRENKWIRRSYCRKKVKMTRESGWVDWTPAWIVCESLWVWTKIEEREKKQNIKIKIETKHNNKWWYFISLNTKKSFLHLLLYSIRYTIVANLFFFLTLHMWAWFQLISVWRKKSAEQSNWFHVTWNECEMCFSLCRCMDKNHSKFLLFKHVFFFVDVNWIHWLRKFFFFHFVCCYISRYPRGHYGIHLLPAAHTHSKREIVMNFHITMRKSE